MKIYCQRKDVKIKQKITPLVKLIPANVICFLNYPQKLQILQFKVNVSPLTSFTY